MVDGGASVEEVVIVEALTARQKNQQVLQSFVTRPKTCREEAVGTVEGLSHQIQITL